MFDSSINLNAYDEFICRAFNYVWPKLNIIDCPISLILHKNDSYTKFGDSDFLGNINMGIGNILSEFRFSDNNTIKNIILDTITHELSHLDQDIDFLKSSNDEIYRNYIEESCMSNAASFVLLNMPDIEKSLDLTIIEELFKNKISQEYIYQRKTIESMYMTKLRYVLNLPNDAARLLISSKSILLEISNTNKNYYVKHNDIYSINPFHVNEILNTIYENKKNIDITIFNKNNDTIHIIFKVK